MYKNQVQNVQGIMKMQLQSAYDYTGWMIFKYRIKSLENVWALYLCSGSATDSESER